MWQLAKFYRHVLEEETRRSKVARMLVKGWRIFLDLGFGAAALYVVWGLFLRTWFSTSLVEAWAVSVLALIICFMLVLLHFGRTYHTRILNEIISNWRESVPRIQRLSGYLHEGEMLMKESDHATETFESRLNDWHRNLAATLGQYSEDYKAKFCQDHNRETKTPAQGEISLWISNHLWRLKTIIEEIESTGNPTKQLVASVPDSGLVG